MRRVSGHVGREGQAPEVEDRGPRFGALPIAPAGARTPTARISPAIMIALRIFTSIGPSDKAALLYSVKLKGGAKQIVAEPVGPASSPFVNDNTPVRPQRNLASVPPMSFTARPVA